MENYFLQRRGREPMDAISKKAQLIWNPRWPYYYENPKNNYCFFVRELTLPAAPEKAEVTLFADSRYRLSVNGQYQSRGPCRSDPKYQYCDVVDVTSALHAGKNVVGVLALHLGYGTGQSVHTVQCLCGQIAVTIGGETTLYCTDSSWKTLPADCWSGGFRINGRQGAMEIFDAVRYPAGWDTPDFDHSGWENSVRMRPRENNPFQFLPARDIPLLEETQIPALGVCAEGQITPVERDDLMHKLIDEVGALTMKPVSRTLPLSMKPNDALLLRYEKVYAGYLTLEIEAEEAAVVDVVYSEYPVKNKPIINTANCPADRFLLKPGTNQLEIQFGWKAFSHVLVLARGAVRLMKAGIRSRRYPLEDVSAFHCDDEAINAIYEMCHHTLRLCMQDGFLDSCSREQQQWIGDGRWEAYLAYFLSADARLQKKMFEQIGQSQDYSGMIKPRHPDQHNNVAPIPAYGFSWVDMAAEYIARTGDKEFLTVWWPNLIHLMRWYTAYENETGLLENVPGWRYIDWGRPPVEMDDGGDGIVSCLNLLYVEALRNMVKLCALTGETAAGEYFAAKEKRLCEAIRQTLWDEKNGVYFDRLDGTHHSTTCGEVTNTLALLLLHDVDEPRAKTILSHILSQKNTADYTYVPSSPYQQGYVYRALSKCGRQDFALEWMRQKYAQMVDMHSSTTWEEWDTEYLEPDGVLNIHSASHGWGAGPLAFLYEELLGIKPLADCWQEFSLTPHLLGLNELSGTMATPYGPISVDYRRMDDAIHARITVPEGTTCLCNGTRYPAGVHEILL